MTGRTSDTDELTPKYLLYAPVECICGGINKTDKGFDTTMNRSFTVHDIFFRMFKEVFSRR